MSVMHAPSPTRRGRRVASRALLGAVALVAAVASLVGAPTASQAATLGTYDYLLAPSTTCANQDDYRLSVATQKQAMYCLIDYARARQGVGVVKPSTVLDQSAQRKAQDIVDCNQFSHYACGRSFDYWIKAYGYTGRRWAENIAWGSNSGARSTPHNIMRAWLHSDGHRINLLNPSYDARGVGLVKARFQGYDAGIWVQHFGGSR